MSYIGNDNITQGFIPAVDFFSGNGSTTAFTLSRPVASVAQVEVYVSNVPQTPNTAYSVSGNTITFTSAPPSGTNNIYVYYTSPITQVIAPGQGTVNTTSLGNITNIASGNSSLTLQTGTTPTTAMTIDTSQNVGIGTATPAGKLQINTTSADCDVRVTATNSGVAAFSVIGYNSSTTITGSNGGATLTLWNKDATANTYSAIESVDASGSLTNKISFVNASDANNEGYMVFQTRPSGGAITERMRIDSSGNVGVGNVTAQYASSRTLASVVAQQNSNGINFCCVNNTNDAYTYIFNDGTKFAIQNSYGASALQKPMLFSASGGNDLYITNAGNVLVGTTSVDGNGGLSIKPSASVGATQLSWNRATSTSSTTAQVFYNAGTSVGGITYNNTTTSFVTSSDYRLKENIAPMSGALDKVSQLNPVTYNWKSDGSSSEGFIAHELAEVVPQCVVGEKDAVDADGNPVYQGIDTSFLVATLTAAIKEQQALIQTLTDRITALENK